MIWAEHVACMETRNVYILVGKPESFRRRRHRWEKIQKLEIRGGGCGLYSSCSRPGSVASFSEHGNKTLGFIKGREFLE
jgi:hypothetical protein